jgi:hypothetical protein
MAKLDSGTRARRAQTSTASRRFFLARGASVLALALAACGGKSSAPSGSGGAPPTDGGTAGVPAPSGTCAFAPTVVSTAPAAASPATLAVVDDAEGVALTWMDYRERAQGVYFVGTDSALDVNRDEQQVTTEEGSVALDSTGQGYGLVRTDGGVSFRALTREGVATGAERPLTTDGLTSIGAASVAWDAAGFGVVWLGQSDQGTTARYAHLDAIGREQRLDVLAESAQEARILWTGHALAALWSVTDGGGTGVYLAELQPDGALLRDVWLQSPPQTNAERLELAFGDDAYGVAWTELSTESEAQVYLRRVGRDGMALAPDLRWPGWLGGLTYAHGSFHVLYSRGLSPTQSYVTEVSRSGSPVVRAVEMPNPMNGKIESRLVPTEDALAVAWVAGGLSVWLAELDCR